MSEQAQVEGDFLVEVDGVQYYSDGYIDNSGQVVVSAGIRIAYFDVSVQYDLGTGEISARPNAVAASPFLIVDSEGTIRVDGVPGTFDLGIARFPDGDYGFLPVQAYLYQKLQQVLVSLSVIVMPRVV